MDHTNGTRVLVRFILVWSEGSWTGEGERENFWNSSEGTGFRSNFKGKRKKGGSIFGMEMLDYGR